eukprot:scaffold85669_cov74-Phaeocystis_antarctica.AAC.2
MWTRSKEGFDLEAVWAVLKAEIAPAGKKGKGAKVAIFELCDVRPMPDVLIKPRKAPRVAVPVRLYSPYGFRASTP